MIRMHVFSKLLASTAVLSALLVATTPVDAQRFRVSPAEPKTCDSVVVEVSRFFSEDCGWTAIADLHWFRNTLTLHISPIASSEICRQVAIEKSFEFDIGRLEAGEWEILAIWTDQPDLDVEPIHVEVSEGVCLDGAHIGDFNSDESFDIADPVALLAHLFRGGDAPCREAGDYDRNRELQVTDAILALQFLFQGGRPSVPAHEVCIPIHTNSSLGCAEPQCEANLDPNDDELIWMEQPDGCLQCRECPATLDITVEKLTQVGVRVFDSAEHFIGVCEACSCPSGRFFRVLVHEDQTELLHDLGWKPASTDPDRVE